jgi:hypothetical protein
MWFSRALVIPFTLFLFDVYALLENKKAHSLSHLILSHSLSCWKTFSSSSGINLCSCGCIEKERIEAFELSDGDGGVFRLRVGVGITPAPVEGFGELGIVFGGADGDVDEGVKAIDEEDISSYQLISLPIERRRLQQRPSYYHFSVC